MTDKMLESSSFFKFLCTWCFSFSQATWNLLKISCNVVNHMILYSFMRCILIMRSLENRIPSRSWLSDRVSLDSLFSTSTVLKCVLCGDQDILLSAWKFPLPCATQYLWILSLDCLLRLQQYFTCWTSVSIGHFAKQ